MSIPSLDRAIALLEQGKRIEAQKILKQLITADQHNLEAWFWLVETCPTNKQRLTVLEMCLEYNPDNEQVKQALEKLRTLSPDQLSAKLPKYENKHLLTNWEAVESGGLLALGVALLLLMLLPASGYFFPFVIVAMILVFPFSIIGALLGKLLLRTRTGIWWGAVILIMLEFWWLSSNSAYLVLSD